MDGDDFLIEAGWFNRPIEGRPSAGLIIVKMERHLQGLTPFLDRVTIWFRLDAVGATGCLAND